MGRKEDRAGLEVRRAVGSDAPAIALVLHEAFLEYEAAYTHEAFLATTPTSEQVEGRMDEGAVWVALRCGVIVGTVGAVPKGEGLYVRSMAVLPAARGLGIGKLLMAQVERFACEGDYKRLFLSTTPFLLGAIGLYETLGFRRTDDGPHDLFGTPLFTMVKSLECGD